MNAVSLLTIWVLLTIVLPALVNNYISNKYPVPEALATAVDQREGFHEKWDQNKAETMNAFYAHYPQFKNFGVPDKQFSWLWYYAMQQMGDDDARLHSTEMKEKLSLRNRATNRIAFFIPALHTQLQLNTLSRSGLDNHLKFLQKTEKFHEQKRLHFYPMIFGEAPVNSEDWSRFNAEYYTEAVAPDLLNMYLPLTVITAMPGLFYALNLKRGIVPEDKFS